jgi:hypothetical protein
MAAANRDLESGRFLLDLNAEYVLDFWRVFVSHESQWSFIEYPAARENCVCLLGPCTVAVPMCSLSESNSDTDLLLITGWWLEHGFYFPIYIGNNHPNWRTHIFQRGRYTTSQSCSLWNAMKVWRPWWPSEPANLTGGQMVGGWLGDFL